MQTLWEGEGVHRAHRAHSYASSAHFVFTFNLSKDAQNMFLIILRNKIIGFQTLSFHLFSVISISLTPSDFADELGCRRYTHY